MRRALALLLAVAAAGCAAPRPLAESSGDASSAQAADAQDQRVHTDLVRGMLGQGQYYAALAHIQAQKNARPTSEELRYLEAEALRRLDRGVEAEALYRGLLGGALAGSAYHGLGLLFAERNLPVAIGYLQQAVRRQPTEVEARNDLGYALMLAGRYADARAELATAVELEPGGKRSYNNLILLLMVQGDEAGARRMAQQAGLSEELLAGLRQEAQSLKARGARRS